MNKVAKGKNAIKIELNIASGATEIRLNELDFDMLSWKGQVVVSVISLLKFEFANYFRAENETCMRIIVLSVLVNVIVIFSFSLSANGQRYWSLMRDGEIHTGKQLKNLNSSKSAVSLDDRNLLAGSKPLRTLRDTTLALERPKSYLEMTNGDVLACRVVEAVIGKQAFPLPDHLIVDEIRHMGRARIRLDWVRRIVANGKSQERWRPNYLRLMDGTEFEGRAIRWSKSEIRVLVGERLLSIPYNQIAELHMPQSQAWQPLYPGAAWLDDASPAVVRSVMADGQSITYPRTMVTTDFDKKLRNLRSRDLPELFATKPPWSLDLLIFEQDAFAFQSYFDAGEYPLSILPVVDELEKSGIHHYRWRRDRSVRGGLLHSGKIISEFGIGMHSYSRLNFKLPTRARTFSSYVGLNRIAGTGGCVHCRIWGDDLNGKPLWERKYLQGKDGVLHVGPLDIFGVKQLILEVDFAHENRPQGADPLDIRDQVDWLLPIVRVEAAKDDLEQLIQVLPEISGWSINPEQLKRIRLRPFWVKRNDLFGLAMVTGSEPLVLSRQVKVSLENAWLPVRATCDDTGGTRTHLGAGQWRESRLNHER